MPAYIVAKVSVTNWDRYSEYMKHTPRIIKKYNGKIIARGAKPETLEGENES